MKKGALSKNLHQTHILGKMVDCTVCGIPTAKKCGKCGKVWYCSRNCQTQDWKNHKGNCNPFDIKETEGKGLGVFATLDLDVGDLIVREDPILQFDGPGSFLQFRAAFEELSRADKAKILALSGGDPDAEEWLPIPVILTFIHIFDNSTDSLLFN